MKYFNFNGLRDYRDPEYEEFDIDAAFDAECDEADAARDDRD